MVCSVATVVSVLILVAHYYYTVREIIRIVKFLILREKREYSSILITPGEVTEAAAFLAATCVLHQKI